MIVAEIVVASVFLALGVRSLLRWIDTEFAAGSTFEQILFALHATARVGLWFAFGGFFLGYALLDEPQGFGWFFLVPVALAALQLLTGALLSRSPSSGAEDG
jgi:hypothetical protein